MSHRQTLSAFAVLQPRPPQKALAIRLRPKVRLAPAAVLCQGNADLTNEPLQKASQGHASTRKRRILIPRLRSSRRTENDHTFARLEQASEKCLCQGPAQPAPLSAVRRWRPLLFVVVSAASYAATGEDTSMPPIETKSGRYLIDYESNPSPVPLNQFFELLVQVKGRHGEEVARNLSLDVDAGMPHHNHGMNIAPKIQALGDGRFQVRGMLFHMRGQWLLSFSVNRGLMRDTAEQELMIE